uniref:KRAB domain-containing protein n=1 Tax=Chelydra serpentina TaxID=8475 RepID=A0A8C3S5C3_CHESE
SAPQGWGNAGSGVPVAFEDVTVCFSPAEWAALADWQRELYWDVMKENYALVASRDAVPPGSPVMLSLPGQGEEPWEGRGLFPSSCRLLVGRPP